MENIKTYAVGNGEITLTESDAEELRLILQKEYLAKVIDRTIDESTESFSFPSKSSRRSFVDYMENFLDDFVNYDSIYFDEVISENIYRCAENSGLIAED